MFAHAALPVPLPRGAAASRMRVSHLQLAAIPTACIATRMDPRASRRVGVLSQHLLAESASPASEVELQPLAGRASSSQSASTSYATATGRPSSYARVHGEVSRAPARWRRIDTVAKEQLREVKYEKAVGEGIAKVRGVGRSWRRQERRNQGKRSRLLATKPVHKPGCCSPRRRSYRSPSTGQRSATHSRRAQVRLTAGRV